MEQFSELQEEISKVIEKAKKARACTPEFTKAIKAKSVEELMAIIKANFHWVMNKKVIDSALIETHRGLFASHDIYSNVDVTDGYLVASGNATVEASGNATVEASGNATVEASGNATVEASGNATVEASGNATVEAFDNATVEAFDNATVRAFGKTYITSYYLIECKLSDNSIYRIRESNMIQYASDTIKFEKQ
jgi:hypothetical protein